MEKPLVTIIAVCYNQYDYVLGTLNSIRDQTYGHIQLIIADDGSTDDSKILIEKWIAEFVFQFTQVGIGFGFNRTDFGDLPV